jgi:hypothetical protein
VYTQEEKRSTVIHSPISGLSGLSGDMSTLSARCNMHVNQRGENVFQALTSVLAFARVAIVPDAERLRVTDVPIFRHISRRGSLCIRRKKRG